ncbi:MAG: 50S ribosomal protein P1 [Candidatus Bathyarchaeota archaeon]|nr:MAG: 50S ribosomal protein P1 [Candidatus Bathyarchaeota archaeon]
MEYVYAAMLLHKAGKPIDEKSITQVLKAAEITADPVRVKALVASLTDVDIEEAIKSPSALIAPAQAPTAAAPEEKPAEETKEKKEEKEKEKEEEALEGLGALFG